MNIQLDFRSHQPIYLQIAEQIRRLVASGELVPGEQLPTVRQVATGLRVNFNTVARAYRLLDKAGLISTQHGRGTYVWETPPPEAPHELRKESLEGLTSDYLQQARSLGYTPEEVDEVFRNQLLSWQERERTPNKVSRETPD